MAFLSQIPGVKVYSPVTYKGLSASLEEALSRDGVSAIRYPSGCEDEKVINAFYSDGGFETIGVRCDFSVDNIPENIIITHGLITS